MGRGEIEKELNSLFEKTKKLVDDAYVKGYKDGYFECIVHKYASKQEMPEIEDKVQVSI